MNNARRHLPTAVALLALGIALGGDAIGDITRKITGKDIAKNAIVSKHVKKNALTSVDVSKLKANDFLSSERAKLVGPVGAKGDKGDTGAAGATGAQGPAGTT